MAELFSVIVQYFEIFDYGRKLRSYTIRFNDGNIKTIHKGMVYQEATCKCEPEYFDRENKS